MTRICKLFLLLSVFSLVGCQDQSDEIITKSDYKISFTAKADNKETRTHLESENEAYGEIWWNENDSLSLFCADVITDGGLTFKAKSSGAETDIEYVSEQQIQYSSDFFGTYPYNSTASFDASSSTISTIVPAIQNATYCSFDPMAAVTAGKSSSLTQTEGNISGQMPFYNVCGGFRLSVSDLTVNKIEFISNAQEPIAGEITISFDGQIPSASPKSGGSVSSDIILNSPKVTLSPDTYYYICMIPSTLSEGFTINFYNDNNLISTCVYTQPVSIERGLFWTIDNADNPSIFGTDLSKEGTSNCYIVSQAGAYKFKVSMGNSEYKPYGDAVSADVLWETVNTATAPAVGSIVNHVSTDGDYVYFRTPDNLTDGNALIAIKDVNGKILWSWHIWVCSDYEPAKTALYFKSDSLSTTLVMDRNLGALSSSSDNQLCNGLLYQWGRKDPFMGVVSRSASPSVVMATTGSFSSISSDDNVGTVAYATANPTQFIYNNDMSGDWIFASRDNTLWTAEKSIYDPCPAGWKVSDGDAEGIWAHADEDHYAMKEVFGGYVKTSTDGTLFFPAAGYIQSEDGAYSGAGTVGYIWTTSTNSQYAYSNYISFAYNKSSFYCLTPGWARANGFSVRCVEE